MSARAPLTEPGKPGAIPVLDFDNLPRDDMQSGKDKVRWHVDGQVRAPVSGHPWFSSQRLPTSEAQDTLGAHAQHSYTNYGTSQPAHSAIEHVQSELALFASHGALPILRLPVASLQTGNTPKVSLPAANADPSLGGHRNITIRGIGGSAAVKVPSAETPTPASALASTVGYEPMSVPGKDTVSNPQTALTSTIDDAQMRLGLLRGPVIKIFVASVSIPEISQGSWSLPKSLVSRYSLTLRDACRRPILNEHEVACALTETDPAIFELFVEWIYYGCYTDPGQHSVINGVSVSIDAQAWILGDRLRAGKFKNYAMTRLYTNAMYNPPEARPVRPQDVEYACLHSDTGSKLRQFYFEYTAIHFTDPVRVEGSIDAWDTVLQNHADARIAMLHGYRLYNDARRDLRKEAFMVPQQEDGQDVPNHGFSNKGSVLGKRNADGVRVKYEPMDT